MIQHADFFRAVPDPPQRPCIDVGSSLFAVGSCFVENMTGKLRAYRSSLVDNPTGVLYNPLSITELLRRLETEDYISREEIFESDGQFRSYVTHTRLNRPTAASYLAEVQEKMSEAREALLSADVVMITLGTAMVWRLKESGAVVANCQKQPGTLFQRDLLSEAAVLEALKECCTRIKRLNSTARIIFTVSPVRYEKARPFLNSVSKGRLFSALEQIVDGEEYLYFPAYEILLDELREYRFFADDLVHPSSLAVQYIWERFIDTYGTERMRHFITLYEEIRRIKEHCTYTGQNRVEGVLREKIIKKIESLESSFPLSFAAERQFFGLS